MNFAEYMKNKARMVKMDSDGNCGIRCESCPLGGLNNGRELFCQRFEHLHPEEAIAIVEKWVKENPIKTYLSEFWKNYPYARDAGEGIPYCCPHDLYGYMATDCPDEHMTCLECWSRPVEERA